MNFENVAVIIQGYSSSKSNLQEIYHLYKSKGPSNIIISSYSKFKLFFVLTKFISPENSLQYV